MKASKKILIALALLAACASRAAAQSPAPAAQVPADSLFHFGSRDVIIPPPEGFVEATSRNATIKKIFETTEAETLDLLAIHMPEEFMKRAERGERPEMNFYTKVSVAKTQRAVDSSQKEFDGLVAYMRANNSKVFDFTSPRVREDLKRQDKTLTELLKAESRLHVSKPLNLGEIASTPDTFGTLLLMNTTFTVGEVTKEKTLLAGLCLVRVRDRLFFVYVYHTFNSETDAHTLREFTRRWLADIVRANAR